MTDIEELKSKIADTEAKLKNTEVERKSLQSTLNEQKNILSISTMNKQGKKVSSNCYFGYNCLIVGFRLILFRCWSFSRAYACPVVVLVP